MNPCLKINPSVTAAIFARRKPICIDYNTSQFDEMTTIRELIGSINALQTYVEGQRANAREPPSSLLVKQSNKLKDQIRKLPAAAIQMQDVNEFIQVVIDANLWSEGITTELEEAITSRLTDGDDVDGGGSSSCKGSKTQYCEIIIDLFTHRVWQYWEESKDDVTLKTLAMIEHVNSLGVTNASEELAGVLASVVACAAMRNPSLSLQSLGVLKRHISTEVREMGKNKPCAHGFIQKFPKTVDDFKTKHPNHYNNAFGDDEPIASPMKSLIEDVASQKFRRRNPKALGDASVPSVHAHRGNASENRSLAITSHERAPPRRRSTCLELNLEELHGTSGARPSQVDTDRADLFMSGVLSQLKKMDEKIDNIGSRPAATACIARGKRDDADGAAPVNAERSLGTFRGRHQEHKLSGTVERENKNRDGTQTALERRPNARLIPSEKDVTPYRGAYVDSEVELRSDDFDDLVGDDAPARPRPSCQRGCNQVVLQTEAANGAANGAAKSASPFEQLQQELATDALARKTNKAKAKAKGKTDKAPANAKGKAATGEKKKSRARRVLGAIAKGKRHDDEPEETGEDEDDDDESEDEDDDDESEDEDDDDDDESEEPPPKKGKSMKRPAAAPLKEKKRVVPAVRPSMPKFSKTKPMETVFYLTGKITASFPKGGFRCFRDCSVSNPSDRTVSWGEGSLGEQKAAWASACQLIEAFQD